jgi:hypothetical protein
LAVVEVSGPIDGGVHLWIEVGIPGSAFGLGKLQHWEPTWLLKDFIDRLNVLLTATYRAIYYYLP